MKLEYVPLLRVQRELYGIPRGRERFQEYLAALVDPETRDLKLPLVALNPMGKEHVPALLDEYLARDTDGAAARAVAVAAAQLTDTPGEFRATLVVSDDAQGGWTNRYAAEFGHRWQSRAYHRRSWLTGILWTSEAPDERAACAEMLTTVFRGAHIQQHGFAATLREMMAQEGYAAAAAGCTEPALDAEEIEYTRAVVAPQLDTRDYPTQMVCLFGDAAAQSLGYPPQGLSARAGLALALHDALVGRVFFGSGLRNP